MKNKGGSFVIVRKLTQADARKADEVSCAAFICSLDDEPVLEEGVTFYGAFLDDGETLFSQIEVYNKECFYGSGILKCAGVGGVATKPEYRRRGGVRACFQKMFDDSTESGYDISILYPFSTAYYRLFGYENAFKSAWASYDFSVLSHIERSTSVELMTEETLGEMTDLYNRIARKQNLMFKRTDGQYFHTEPYKEKAWTYFALSPDGEKTGYVSITPNRAESTIWVSEIGFLNKAALVTLLGFLRTFDGNFKKLTFDKLPMNSPIFDVLADENKLAERKFYCSGSARILNLENVLKLNIYPKEKGSFILKSVDECIARNNGTFRVEYENGKAAVTKADGEKPDITLNAPALARVLLAREGLDAEALSYIDGAEISGDITDFLKAFPHLTTAFYDGF